MQNRASAWLIVVSAVVGSIIAIPVSGEQISIDGALALTGTVKYAPDQYMAQFHFLWWTAVNQLCAALLWLGIKQSIVAVAPAVIAIGILTSGLAMLIFGLTKNPVISFLAAIFCVCTGTLTPLFSSPDFGAYGGRGILSGPIGYSAIYGMSAGALSSFSIGALSAGRNTLGGISAGILISVHPVMGAFVVGMMLALLVLKNLVINDLSTKGLAKGLLIGCALSALSFAVFWIMKVPSIGEVDQQDFATYLKVWDSHRATAMTLHNTIRVLVGTLLLFLMCVVMVAFSAGQSWATAVTFIALSTATSTFLYFSVHLIPQLLPQFVIRAIPGRFLDVHAYVAGPFLIGFALSLSPYFFKLSKASQAKPSQAKPPYVMLAALVLLWSPILPSQTRSYLGSVEKWISTHSHYDDPFWQKVRNLEDVGPVLASQTAYYHAVRYGHLAAVFDPGDFDFTAYLPHIVKQTRHYIERGFGVSFENPPAGMRNRPNLGPDGGREYWQQMSEIEWNNVVRELGFLAVIAPSEWKINLPVRLRSNEFSLYEIRGIRQSP